MEKPQAKKKKTSTNSTNSKLNGTRSQGTKKTSAKKIDTVKKSVPSSTDSVAVYMRNSDKRSSLSGIANAAEKKIW